MNSGTRFMLGVMAVCVVLALGWGVFGYSRTKPATATPRPTPTPDPYYVADTKSGREWAAFTIDLNWRLFGEILTECANRGIDVTDGDPAILDLWADHYAHDKELVENIQTADIRTIGRSRHFATQRVANTLEGCGLPPDWTPESWKRTSP